MWDFGEINRKLSRMQVSCDPTRLSAASSTSHIPKSTPSCKFITATFFQSCASRVYRSITHNVFVYVHDHTEVNRRYGLKSRPWRCSVVGMPVQCCEGDDDDDDDRDATAVDW